MVVQNADCTTITARPDRLRASREAGLVAAWALTGRIRPKAAALGVQPGCQEMAAAAWKQVS